MSLKKYVFFICSIYVTCQKDFSARRVSLQNVSYCGYRTTEALKQQKTPTAPRMAYENVWEQKQPTLPPQIIL